jgi:CheY-like chemotaxis protein
LNTGRYDLLITDNHMPKLTGLQLLLKIRSARMTIPVILVSGMMPTAELARHPQLQIEATLLKPYTAETFLWTVENVFRATSDVRWNLGNGRNRQFQPQRSATG